MANPIQWVVVCTLAFCMTIALCTASATAALASAWAIQRTPNPAGARFSVLSGVSCSSRTACTAVGYFTSRTGTGVTLAERWDGSSWSIERTLNPSRAASSLLFGVSCPSSTACTAVGSVTNRAGTTVPLVEGWNGTSWTIRRTPKSARASGSRLTYLGSVSCTSPTACVAVGYSGNSDGTAGVTLAERWNGRGWVVQRTPHLADATVGFLSGVSCVSQRSCTATGFFISRDGTGASLAEHWNGARWEIEPTPNPAAATNVQLARVSCVRQGLCTAVGFFSIVTGIEVMLAERWNGVSWSIQRTLYPAGATGVQFAGVSCALPRACTAVGFFGNAAGLDQTLVERWNGKDWAIQPTPSPAGASSYSLGGVSCTSTTACTAVGGFINRAGTGVTLAERSS